MRLCRQLTILLGFLFLAVSSIHAADVKFVRVWPNWIEAEAFESISEYFSGREATGKRIIVRSQPDTRAGFYYVVRVNSAEPHASATFSLQLIMPGNPEPKRYSFPVDVATRSTLFQLGLTGSDWPDREVHPVAWKLDLLSADQQVLATAQSFLWSKPAK